MSRTFDCSERHVAGTHSGFLVVHRFLGLFLTFMSPHCTACSMAQLASGTPMNQRGGALHLIVILALFLGLFKKKN